MPGTGPSGASLKKVPDTYFRFIAQNLEMIEDLLIPDSSITNKNGGVKMNIVDLLKGQLGGEVSKTLGGMAGIGEGDLSKVMGAALPGLLSGLGSLASSKSGAGKISDAIGGLDPGMLGNLAGMLTGSASKQGGGMLGNLFGGSVVDGLAAAVSKFTGVNSGIVKTVLGYLAPLVLGGVAKSLGGAKVDSSAISNLFASQKSNIAASLPKGFSLDSIQGFASLASAGGASGGSSKQAAPAPASGGGGKLALIGLALAALIGLYFYWDKVQKAAKDSKDAVAETTQETMTSGEKAVADATTATKDATADAMKVMADTAKAAGDAVEEAKDKAAQMVKSATDTAQDLKDKAASSLSGAMDAMKGDFSSMLEGLTGKLSKVSDAASAEEFLPELEGYSTKLDGLAKSVSALPSEGKSMIADMVKAQIEKLNPIFEKLTGMPGIGEAFVKLIDQIKSKLMGLVE